MVHTQAVVLLVCWQLESQKLWVPQKCEFTLSSACTYLSVLVTVCTLRLAADINESRLRAAVEVGADVVINTQKDNLKERGMC